MRSRKKKYSPRRTSPGRRVLLWLSLGAVLALVGWLWWEERVTSSALPSAAPARTRPQLLETSTPPIGTTLTVSSNAPEPITQPPPTMPVPLLLPAKAVQTVSNTDPETGSNKSNHLGQVSPDRSQIVLEAQVALAQQAISPGSIDGVMGSQTRATVRAFQRKERLSVTGELDDATRARLIPIGPLLVNYTVTTGDLARLHPLAYSWLGKSLQPRLDYETILELVAEKSRAHPNLIRRFNPGIDWTGLRAGTVLQVPNSECPAATTKAAYAEIDLAARALEVFDAQGSLLAHFPCSIAQRMDKRPVGELHVEKLIPDPNYTFNPKVFPESAEGRELGRKLILQPGPNNPVGSVWIGLDRPGYGIHGTPQPEHVGRTESHGCFRLANWNAEYLLQLAWVGMPVFVLP